MEKMLCTNPALSANCLHVKHISTAALDNRISQFCPATKPDVKERGELNQKSPNPYLVRIVELILTSQLSELQLVGTLNVITSLLIYLQ